MFDPQNFMSGFLSKIAQASSSDETLRLLLSIPEVQDVLEKLVTAHLGVPDPGTQISAKAVGSDRLETKSLL